MVFNIENKNNLCRLLVNLIYIINKNTKIMILCKIYRQIKNFIKKYVLKGHFVTIEVTPILKITMYPWFCSKYVTIEVTPKSKITKY